MKQLYHLFIQPLISFRSVMIITIISGGVLFVLSCKDEEEFVPLNIKAVQPQEVLIGDTLTIIGEGFSPGYVYNHVIFKGASGYATPLDESTTNKLIVVVPNGAQSGPVTVNILNEEIANSPELTVFAPVVNTITPDHAWIGDTITITGENFQPNKALSSVEFSTPAVSDKKGIILSATREEMTLIIPYTANSGIVKVLGYDGPEITINPSQITSIVPEQGMIGDTITVNGQGLMTQAGVNNNLVFTNDIQGSILLNRSTSRKISVVVPDGIIDGPLTYLLYNSTPVISTQEFKAYPRIIDVMPLNGEAGIEATITGSSFSNVKEENIVRFNGLQAQVTSATTKELHVTVPAGVSTGQISLSVNGRAATGPVFQVTAAGTPIILSVSPRSGPKGSNVVINGKYFNVTASANTVRIGNTQATVLSGSATQLVIKIPEAAVSGAITVTTEGKTGTGPVFTVTSGTALPFITSITPSHALPGNNITIRGGNFTTNASAVSVNVTGGTSDFTTVSATAETVVATVPAGYQPGDYSIYVSQFGDNSNKASFSVDGQPHIDVLSLTEGEPGTLVTITGTQFNAVENGNTVKFSNNLGDHVATIVDPADANPAAIKVYVPDVAAGIYNVSVTAFGNASNTLPFTIKEKPVAVKNIYFATVALGQNGQVTRIMKNTFDPPSSTTVYELINTINITALSVDFTHNKVYFVRDGKIIRSNLNNTGYQELYAVNAFDITLDVAHNKIFWTADDLLTVYSASMDGGGTPQVVYSGTGAGEEAYFTFGISYEPTEDMLYMVSYNEATAPRVVKAKADGSGPVIPLFDDTDGLSMNIALVDVRPDVVNNKLFIIDDNKVYAGNLDGTGSLTTMFTPQSGYDVTGMGLDIQDAFLYTVQSNSVANKSEVYRKTYDGSMIVGTNPLASIQKIYDLSLIMTGNSGIVPTGIVPVGLVVEESTGRAGAQRQGFSAMRALKIPMQHKQLPSLRRSR